MPDNLFGIAKKELLLEMLDDLADGLKTEMTPDLIDEKVASMSCKAAVKGNNRLSAARNGYVDRRTSDIGQSVSLPAWEADNYRNDPTGTRKEI